MLDVFVRPTALVAVVASAVTAIGSQTQGTDKPKHPTVCAAGVKTYDTLSEVPVPYDSVEVPRPAAPVMITSPEEAEAAQMDLLRRAGSVGATGIVVSVVTQDDGMGRITQRRSVQGVFVPSDSARAQLACKR